MSHSSTRQGSVEIMSMYVPCLCKIQSTRLVVTHFPALHLHSRCRRNKAESFYIPVIPSSRSHSITDFCLKNSFPCPSRQSLFIDDLSCGREPIDPNNLDLSRVPPIYRPVPKISRLCHRVCADRGAIRAYRFNKGIDKVTESDYGRRIGLLSRVVLYT